MKPQDEASNDSGENVLAYRQKRRVNLGGSGCAAFGLGILGLILLFSPLFLIGIGFLILACFVDAKKGYISFCGSCGNDAAPTANLCPTCHAELIPLPRRRVSWTLGALFLLGCAALIAYAGYLRWEAIQAEAKQSQAPASEQ